VESKTAIAFNKCSFEDELSRHDYLGKRCGNGGTEFFFYMRKFFFDRAHFPFSVLLKNKSIELLPTGLWNGYKNYERKRYMVS